MRWRSHIQLHEFNWRVSGTLVQLIDKPRGARSRLSATFGGKSASDKEVVRQCFLFSNHLLLTTRQSDDDGRLSLVSQVGKIPLSDAVLIEDPSDQGAVDDDGNYSLIELVVNVSHEFPSRFY